MKKRVKYIKGETPLMEAQGFLMLVIDIKNMIHHSDRGVQYTSAAYVNSLKYNNIQISL